MHELGIVMNIVKTIENFSLDNNVTKVASITLQVGELSSVVPRYLHECYPAATYKSELLRKTKLNIEILPANCICHSCEKVFSFKNHRDLCPLCGSNDSEIISGKEFLIKEIEAC